MSYDLYVEQPGGNPATKLRLLITQEMPAIQAYLLRVHGKTEKDELISAISEELDRMRTLGLFSPLLPDLQGLPLGSWFLQFTFTLAKPWMSKDDDPFYVAESVNPVRKDKVFKVPLMAASSWKGILHWTTMQIHLAQRRAELSAEAFAQERFRQTLLFGDEKGEEPERTKDLAGYLDNLNRDAKPIYQRMVKEHFRVEPDKDMPHHAGRLMCYPTFFDLIDVEVINPHSRETKAGTHPIYLECVPAGAKGTFSLLYVPFDLVGRENEGDINAQAKEDLCLVAEAIKAMMLTYGFSAKRTSGYGTAKDELENGKVCTRAHPAGWPLTRLSRLPEEVKNVRFDGNVGG